jgi:antitoxin component YwqK of YwqJK toxin-antitoxin module
VNTIAYGGYDLNMMEMDPLTGLIYPRWYIIDSLGARMKYDGVYEQYYMNGQLFFRYEFENGQLKREDTLFWDNGNPLDVIVFQPDSNQYYRNLYARDGILYDVMIYDSLGAFVKYLDKEQPEANEIAIDGVVATENRFRKRQSFSVEPVEFYYKDNDTLKHENLYSKVILLRTWAEDTTIQLNKEYDARTREYTYEKYNCFGDVHSRIDRTFTDDFSGWTGTKISTYGDLTLKRTQSGVRYEVKDEVLDTMGHRSVLYSWRLYDVTSDIQLLKDGEPFTGEFNYKEKSWLSRIKSKSNEVNVLYSREYYGYNKFYRAQRKKKKAKRFMLNSFTNDIRFADASSQIRRDFSDFFTELVYDDNQFLGYSAYASKSDVKLISGNFLDGKPHGVWTATDRKGNLVSMINFNRGEPDGELRLYDYQNKRPQRDYSYYYDDGQMKYLDSFPKRRTHYLKQVVNFKNGQREGECVECDWLGRVLTSANFVNDEVDGKMISRDHEVHTEATFKDGYLDGYLRTYLTFPKRDSMLLYDINLQNGMLNGESKSYHTNGKLAKRGFFLDDEPIEDYEAYDTLGFKFHYVKFQYGMPVEEKIWEENALSIRYQFNWEDSIEFYPDDITSTLSLEALLAKEGYTSYSIQDKYYGRTALISKDEIECQMTKYYPNDTVARDGRLRNKQKIGLWKFYSYNGDFLYEANYFDSIIVINDSVKFKSKGILTDYDDEGNRLYSAYIIEKFEKYDCAHTDHYEIRQLLTIDEESDTLGRMNGQVQNFYDNGTLQSQGTMKNGIPDGLWKFYDPYGKLNKMGNYTLGKRNGRWLEGDLEKKKYLGEICMNPNLPDLKEQQEYQENLLDITIINYVMGKLKNTQYYDLNMNRILELEESKNN